MAGVLRCSGFGQSKLHIQLEVWWLVSVGINPDRWLSLRLVLSLLLGLAVWLLVPLPEAGVEHSM
jgi:hypothetical protein